MKVQIEVNEKQAQTILLALDLISRIGIGQLKELDYTLKQMGVSVDSEKNKEVSVLLNELKSMYYPDLVEGSSYGIFGEKVPVESKSSWDMIQVIRHAIAWHNKPEGGITVDFDMPFQSVKSEPLIQVKIIE